MGKRIVVAVVALAIALLPASVLAPTGEARCRTVDRAYGACTYVAPGGSAVEQLVFSAWPPVADVLPVRGYIAHEDKSSWWVARVTAALVEKDDAYFGGTMLWWRTNVPPGSDAPERVETNVYVAVHDGRLPGGGGDKVFVSIGDLVDPAALVAAKVMPPKSTVPIASGEIVVLDF